MYGNATTSFFLEATEQPPDPVPTDNPSAVNSVKTGDFVASFSIVLILVAFAVSVVVYYKMRKASKKRIKIKNNCLLQNVSGGDGHVIF